MPTNNSWDSQDPVQVTKGGTGLNTVAQGDLLIASASNTLASLPKNTSATRYLSNTGINNDPAYAQVDLSNGVTGTLPVGNGGTGLSTATTAYGVLAAGTTATGPFQNIGTGASGEVLTSNGAGALPTFQAAGGGGGAMVLLHSITFNNTAANYDITAFVTGYDIYKFFVSNLPTGTSNPEAALQFSTNGGSTWITTGYLNWQQYFTNTGTAGSSRTDMARICPFNGPAGFLNQSEAMMSGYGGSNGVVVHSTCGCTNNSVAVSQIETTGLLTASLNGIRLTNTAGTNFPSGKFSIYGIAT